MFGATDSIFGHDPGRGTMTRVTFEGNAQLPFCSRDGRRIGFVSDRDGSLATFVADADGSGRMRRVADESLVYPCGFVDVEGEEVMLFRRDNGLWVKPLDAPARELMASPFAMRFACVSPDQRWVAYTSDESGQDEVYVRPFPGGEGKWQGSIGGGGMQWWLPGSDALAYRAGQAAIRVARRAPDADTFADVRSEEL